jgi:3-dehydroquinate dehydratase-2
MQKLLIINGPNLDKLGTREPEVYGSSTLADLEDFCVKSAKKLNFDLDFRQSNSETEIIEWLHEASANQWPVIMNPAAFTHYSVAIRDAAVLLKSPLIEVHLSNPLTREEFRHTSLISGIAKGTISGFGVNSYLLAMQAMAKELGMIVAELNID